MVVQPERLLLKKQIQKYSRYVTGNVLDLGSGEINRYKHFFSPKKYTSMDVVDTFKPDVIGSITKMPFKANMFDSIICTQVLEHVDEPFEAVSEMFRVLKKDGVALVTVPQWNELHEEPHDYYRYTRFGLKYMFEKKGFKIIALEQRGSFWSFSAQVNVRFLIDTFKLFQRPWLEIFFKIPVYIYVKLAIFVDKLMEKNKNYQKHTIGYILIVKK